MSFRLPPFLAPHIFRRCRPPGSLYLDAVFNHEFPLGPVHSLWWPNRDDNKPPNVILLFIPGNPGLLDFYIPFLSAIHNKNQNDNVAIFAHAHSGHTPDFFAAQPQPSHLVAQVEGALGAFDAASSTFKDARIILIGHSVGAWIVLQVLKQRPQVSGVFLLFPTISHISSTPNGQKLSWVFTPFWRRFLVLSSYLTWVLPTTLLSLLFYAWPPDQVHVLVDFLRSPRSIMSSLSMAHDEMSAIRDLDLSWIDHKTQRLFIYLADHDDWVGNQKTTILEFLTETGLICGIVHGQPGIPHAFCISKPSNQW
ncbi:hypothetical protein BD779DRAFT_1486254 [Infundibulicybe gibba]|nr:hypothetical protein BD779DRAFT_1486254 [Infundibulicybe gibba]